MNNWQIFKNVFDGDKETVSILSEIGLRLQSWSSSKRWRCDGCFEMSRQEWEVRKKPWAGIETKETKAIDQAAVSAGALFSRVCDRWWWRHGVFLQPEVRSEVRQRSRCRWYGHGSKYFFEAGIEVSVESSRRERS